MVGFYTGTNLLNLSWLPEPEHLSDGTMRVEKVAGGNFWQLTYTWTYHGEAQDGAMLLGISPKTRKATMAWGDSWHQNGSLMVSQGEADESGQQVSVLGYYRAESGPDWGWRISLSQPDPDTFEMVMMNITPEGAEDLAVRATYRRAPQSA